MRVAARAVGNAHESDNISVLVVLYRDVDAHQVSEVDSLVFGFGELHGEMHRLASVAEPRACASTDLAFTEVVDGNVDLVLFFAHGDAVRLENLLADKERAVLRLQGEEWSAV